MFHNSWHLRPVDNLQKIWFLSSSSDHIFSKRNIWSYLSGQIEQPRVFRKFIDWILRKDIVIWRLQKSRFSQIVYQSHVPLIMERIVFHELYGASCTSPARPPCTVHNGDTRSSSSTHSQTSEYRGRSQSRAHTYSIQQHYDDTCLSSKTCS